MRKLLFIIILALLAGLVRAAEPPPTATFEKRGSFSTRNPIDAAVLSALKRKNIKPAARCSDAVFFRRVHLDLLGMLPEPQQILAFLENRRGNKRAKLIDELLLRDEFAEYQALKWCDLLRVKAEFPINLWPNAVQAYYRWIRDSIRDNRPYDEFARALLTSSGSNFRVAPVNFLRAVQSRSPSGLAQATALTLMGSRIEQWPEDRRKGMEVFFSRVTYKRTAEWKEEIVTLSPAPAGPLVAMFPDGTVARIAPDEDPRKIFAQWLIRPSNEWFTKNVVNRVWCWLVGRGVIHQPDDIREGNPPSNPKLLAVLEKELVSSGYDLRSLYRKILNSSTYQQSPVPRSDHREAEALFAHYIVRPLGAEVLIDALCQITGSTEKYMSAIPEPFTNIPEEQRSVALSDGSISSPFLEMFGRPARDTGLQSERNQNPTEAQRLHMLNSSDVQRRIEQSPRLGALLARSRRDPKKVVENLYLIILSRLPTARELDVIRKYAGRSGPGTRAAAADLVWALLNTKEFLYRH